MKKKVFYGIIGGLFILGMVAFFCFYNYRQEETVAFCNKVVEWLNQPLPIVGVSIIVVGGTIYKLLSQTSIGKKKIEQIKEIVSNSNESIEQYKIALETYKSLAESELNAKEQEIQELKAFIQKVCETIPNKKVNELVKELISEYEREETIDTQTTTDKPQD